MSLSESILSLIQDPNVIGEILRDKFFKQDRENGKLGCYSTFELREDVKQLPDENNYDEGINVTVSKLDDVIMKYYWCGDGTLQFFFDDGQILSNYDAKKTYNWGFD